MKLIFRTSIFLAFVCLLSVLASAQPKIPKDQIPDEVPSEVKEQIQRLYSSDAVERGRAAHHLGKMRTKAAPAIPFLIDILGDEAKLRWQSRWQGVDIPGRATSPGREAAKALGKIGEQAAEPLIVTLKDENPDVRRRVAETLGEIEDERAVEPLIKAMDDNDTGVRTRAAIALWEMGHAGAVEIEPLIAGLSDPSYFVSKQAAKALGKIGGPQAVEPLIETLTSGRFYSLQSIAAEELGKVGDDRAVEPLTDALKHEQALVRKHAAEALGKIGDARAVEPLIKALEDESTDVGEKAAKALGKIGDSRAVEPLIKAFQEDSGVRMWAAYALWSIGDARAVEPFIKALDDENVAVKMRAEKTLENITGQSFGDNQQKWQTWWDENKDEVLKDN